MDWYLTLCITPGQFETVGTSLRLTGRGDDTICAIGHLMNKAQQFGPPVHRSEGQVRAEGPPLVETDAAYRFASIEAWNLLAR